MSVEELPAPVAGPEEVVVEVDSAGICGTDLHIYLDEFETAPRHDRPRICRPHCRDGKKCSRLAAG